MMRFSALSLLVCALFMHPLHAVPSFARNLGVDCTVCHTAYPQLTEYGKIFLEMGGDLLIQKEYGNYVTMTPQNFSGHIYFLPIDYRGSSDSTAEKLTHAQQQLKLRVYQEADAYIAGRINKAFFFNVIAATDDGGFNVDWDSGYAVYRLLESLSLFGGWASPFIPDGNDTVFHENVLNRQWKAADYTPQQSQMLGLNGLYKNFWWIAAWHGAADVSEGNDPKSFSLRAAYDAAHQTVGAYFSRSYLFNDQTDRSVHPFYEYGIDGHFRFQGANILFVAGLRKKEGRDTDFDVSFEMNKIFTYKSAKSGLRSIIPIVNLDVYKDRDLSPQTWVAGSAGVAFYPTPAIRFLPQIAGTVRAPNNYKHKEVRFLISADIGI